MFLTLNHKNLEVYNVSRNFVAECYKITKYLPSEERFVMVAQIKRASLSIHLNIAEGCSRRSESERKRYFEIARGSLIEIDAAFEIAHSLDYLKNLDLTELANVMISCFKLLTKLIHSHH